MWCLSTWRKLYYSFSISCVTRGNEEKKKPQQPIMLSVKHLIIKDGGISDVTVFVNFCTLFSGGNKVSPSLLWLTLIAVWEEQRRLWRLTWRYFTVSSNVSRQDASQTRTWRRLCPWCRDSAHTRTPGAGSSAGARPGRFWLRAGAIKPSGYGDRRVSYVTASRSLQHVRWHWVMIRWDKAGRRVVRHQSPS